MCFTKLNERIRNKNHFFDLDNIEPLNKIYYFGNVFVVFHWWYLGKNPFMCLTEFPKITHLNTPPNSKTTSQTTSHKFKVTSKQALKLFCVHTYNKCLYYFLVTMPSSYTLYIIHQNIQPSFSTSHKNWKEENRVWYILDSSARYSFLLL